LIKHPAHFRKAQGRTRFKVTETGSTVRTKIIYIKHFVEIWNASH